MTVIRMTGLPRESLPIDFFRPPTERGITMTDPRTTAEGIRSAALDSAVYARTKNDTAETIVARAEAFAAFLSQGQTDREDIEQTREDIESAPAATTGPGATVDPALIDYGVGVIRTALDALVTRYGADTQVTVGQARDILVNETLPQVTRTLTGNA